VTGHPNALLEAGLAHIRQGRPVFVLTRNKCPAANCHRCRPGDPGHDPEACPCLFCHGFYAATTDPDRLRAMLHTMPGGMLAMRTGAASGIVVADIDPDHGGQVDPDLMPPTATVVTGSGGWHLWYRHPGGYVPCSQSRIGPGIDIRADGGYVVIPPSVHPRTHHPYRWSSTRRPITEMAGGLVEACQPPRPTPCPSTTRAQPNTRSTPVITRPDKLLAAHLDAVRNAPPGRRRNTLYGAARGVARMVSEGALDQAEAVAVLETVGREAGQEDRKVRAAIAGGFRDEGVLL
jgi:hypothetical protein